MRGVILAGGLGTRLKPLTNIANKHLLPVYSKPMIYYPIETLIKSEIKEIAIVVSGKNPGQFIEILKNGEEFGLKSITYLYQEKPDGGISNALGLAKNFASGENIAVILGDNVTDADISQSIKNFKDGAHIFLKEVTDPERFGCPCFNNKKIVEIIEKPPKNKIPSNYAVTGLYLYDNKVFDYIDECKLSSRNQLEISDCNNSYIREDKLSYSFLEGFWSDAGTPDSLFKAGEYWYNKQYGVEC